MSLHTKTRRVIVELTEYEYRVMLQEAKSWRKLAGSKDATWRDVAQNEFSNAMQGLAETIGYPEFNDGE